MSHSTDTAHADSVHPETVHPETVHTDTAEQPVSAEQPEGTENRSTTPSSNQFQQFIGSEWAERVDELPAPREQAPFAARRRDTL